MFSSKMYSMIWRFSPQKRTAGLCKALPFRFAAARGLYSAHNFNTMPQFFRIAEGKTQHIYEIPSVTGISHTTLDVGNMWTGRFSEALVLVESLPDLNAGDQPSVLYIRFT